MVEVRGKIRFSPGSRLRRIYGTDEAEEGYHCNFGLNPEYEPILRVPFQIAARDAAGEVRAIELTEHPFFIATLFQPERAALAGREHPLITAFVTATGSHGIEQ